MKLEIFDKYTLKRVGIIKTYNYVTYSDGLREEGSFQLDMPTSEESLVYLTPGNYIWFEGQIMGVVEGIRDMEDQDTKITITGYLLNHILTYRSNLLTYKKYDKVGNVARQMFTDLFINPEDTKRKINGLSLSDDTEDIIKFPQNATWQNTGDTFFDCISDMFDHYGLGFELIPTLENGASGVNIADMQFRVITPHDRTFGNTEGNKPIVFSFDLNNVLWLQYEEDERQYKTTAIVASEGEAEERKVIEVGDTEITGIDRIELYVDARDIQTDSDPEDPLTEEELEELMEERGLQKLSECVKYITFDGSINADGMNYVYGTDFYKGDYVSVIDKRMNKKFNIQITQITKTISEGVEHFDIHFGVDRIDILNKKERRLYNV